MWFPKKGEAYYRADNPVLYHRPGGYSEYSDHHWAKLVALGEIVKTQEEAQRIHDEAEEKARKALEPEPWVPNKQGQQYFYISTDEGDRLVLLPDYYEPGDVFDEMRIADGNCFETAQACLECIAAELKVRKEIRMKQAERNAVA